jgi:hypothetical protein
LVKRLANHHEEEIRIFLDVEDNNLQCFPWQDWEFFEDHCPNAEVTLYKRINTNKEISLSDAVKVLVVVGNNEGIEEGVQEDLNAIQELENQKRGGFKVLKQPSRHDLLSELRSKSYQIFIFTGHSGSDSNKDIGWIELSETDHLKISDLKLALREAITGGLQLCIFNSCDGLGLAKQLNQLKLPLAIVMREPVPDDVAAKFLRVFLENYSGGESFFKSFREARHQLEGFNRQYPHVYWLPTVCTGVLGEPPTWLQLIGKNKPKLTLPVRVAVISIVALIGVGLIRVWIESQRPNITPSPELFSLGEKKLTPESAFSNQLNCWNNIEQKERGIQQFQQQQFQQAAESFQNYHKVAVVYESNSEYSNSLSETFGNSLDLFNQGSIIYDCDLSDPNFSPSQCVEDAYDKGADVLTLFPSSQLSTDTQNLILQNFDLQFSGRQSLPLLAGDAVYGGRIRREVGEEVEGMVVAVPWHPNFKNAASTTFLNTAKQLWGTESVNWRTANSYDATMALVEGLRQLEDNPTREGLKKVLSSDEFSVEGATGIVEFDGGDRKITSKNQDELGILVEVQCNYDDCNFVPFD